MLASRSASLAAVAGRTASSSSVSRFTPLLTTAATASISSFSSAKCFKCSNSFSRLDHASYSRHASSSVATSHSSDRLSLQSAKPFLQHTQHRSFSTSTSSDRQARSSPPPSRRRRRPGDQEETESQRHRREKKEKYVKRAQEQRTNFHFEGFDLPPPPTGQQVARHLKDEITTLKEDEKLPSSLIAYGLNGLPARLLLQFELEQISQDGRIDDLPVSMKTPTEDVSENVSALFHIWSTEAADQMAELGLQYDARQTKDSADSGRTVPSTSTPTPTSTTMAFNTFEDVMASFAIEGETCLSRFCISSFLDWVEAGLSSLSPTLASASDRAEVALVSSQLRLLRRTTDLRLPVHLYPLARTLVRHIHLHVGPTNSGKTHGALVALSKARTGVFAGPLRLLAHEVWDRFNSGTISPGVPPRACNLITGEEQRTVDPFAGLYSCTVEMVSLDRTVDVAVVDEIQMIADPNRGYAWTDAVLGIPAQEIHLCGEASVIPLIERMVKACGDQLTVHEYTRLTPLKLSSSSLNNDLNRIKTGDCIVAFSRSGIFQLKREIEHKTGLRCAVAYGALPPETKSEQAKLFNQGKLDVMVASDAIGMGLNLKIKRIIFDTMTKWNGKEQVVLSASQIKQIAGRAGRYGTSRSSSSDSSNQEDNEDVGGFVTTRHADELDILRQALESPLRPVDRAAIQPRSETLVNLSAMLPPPTTTSSSSSTEGEHGKQGKKEMRRHDFRTLSEIYTDVSLLSRIDSRTYFMSDFSQQHAISPLVETSSRGLLTVRERETFSNAPANIRDERVMQFLSLAVEKYSMGGLVKFDDCAQGLGILEMEEETMNTMKEAKELREEAHRQKNQSIAGKGGSGSSGAGGGVVEDLPLAGYLVAQQSLLNVNTLLLLESLHRSMTLYLWLSFRFPLSFCYRASIDQRKKRLEEGIDFVLEAIRFGRARRLRALGRLDDANRVFEKPKWKHRREEERERLLPNSSSLDAVADLHKINKNNSTSANSPPE